MGQDVFGKVPMGNGHRFFPSPNGAAPARVSAVAVGPSPPRPPDPLRRGSLFLFRNLYRSWLAKNSGSFRTCHESGGHTLSTVPRPRRSVTAGARVFARCGRAASRHPATANRTRSRVKAHVHSPTCRRVFPGHGPVLPERRTTLPRKVSGKGRTHRPPGGERSTEDDVTAQVDGQPKSTSLHR